MYDIFAKIVVIGVVYLKPLEIGHKQCYINKELDLIKGAQLHDHRDQFAHKKCPFRTTTHIAKDKINMDINLGFY